MRTARLPPSKWGRSPGTRKSTVAVADRRWTRDAARSLPTWKADYRILHEKQFVAFFHHQREPTTSAAVDEWRAAAKDAGVRLSMVRNADVKLAMVHAKANYGTLDRLLAGPTALVHSNDGAAFLKHVSELAKIGRQGKAPSYMLLAALYGDQLLFEDDIKRAVDVGDSGPAMLHAALLAPIMAVVNPLTYHQSSLVDVLQRAGDAKAAE